MSGRVRVMVVDDHPMVAEGIEAILATCDHIEVVATLGSGPEAIMALDEFAPDVVLMDLDMPGRSGLSATEIILERRPETRVLVLSMRGEAEQVGTALRHGASGCVLSDVPTDEIRTAIDAVMRGERYLPAAAAAPPPVDGLKPLTRRERTVLLLLAEGRDSRDIAGALAVSPRTVETHRRNIMRKLGLRSPGDLARYVAEHRVLERAGG